MINMTGFHVMPTEPIHKKGGDLERTFVRNGIKVEELILDCGDGVLKVVWCRESIHLIMVSEPSHHPADPECETLEFPNPCIWCDFNSSGGQGALDKAREQVAEEFDRYWSGQIPFRYAGRNEHGKLVG